MEKSKKRDESSSKLDHIPHDIEIEILSRLPGKSLMKLKLVSKMWSSIIQSQRFVDSYYAFSTTMRSRLKIAFSNNVKAKDDDKRLFIFSCSNDQDRSSSLVTNLDMTIPSVSLLSGSNCTSIHGHIVCSTSRGIIVCNPSTNKITTLAEPRTSLGYDPVDGRFKALTMLSNPYSYKEDFLVHKVVTLGGDGETSLTRNRFASPRYHKATNAICINGFVYWGAWKTQIDDRGVIVCFDVRHEKLSFIKSPTRAFKLWNSLSMLIEYKGKFAFIAERRRRSENFYYLDLWILEDVETHDWSKQTLDFPTGVATGFQLTCSGTNKAGEIIFAPRYLPRDVKPFYIFYYNVERKSVRRVRLHGIADDEEFRRRYGIAEECRVCIAPQHIESIAPSL